MEVVQSSLIACDTCGEFVAMLIFPDNIYFQQDFEHYVDVMMPETDGLEALEQLREKSPQTKVVMMSAHDNPTYVARSVALGAEGFVLKDALGEEIVAAILRAERGEDPPADSKLSEIRQRLGTRLDPVADDVPLTTSAPGDR